MAQGGGLGEGSGVQGVERRLVKVYQPAIKPSLTLCKTSPLKRRKV